MIDCYDRNRLIDRPLQQNNTGRRSFFRSTNHTTASLNLLRNATASGSSSEWRSSSVDSAIVPSLIARAAVRPLLREHITWLLGSSMEIVLEGLSRPRRPC